MFRFAALLLLPGLVACNAQSEPKDAGPPAKVVRVAPVKSLALTHNYALTGTTRAVQRAIVAPQVSGVLKRRLVDLGDRVEQGAVLARLDNPELKPALKAATARLAELRVQSVQAQRDWKRIEKLYTQGVVTRREKEESKTRCDATIAAVHSAEAEVNRAKRLAGELLIHAPIAGVVEHLAIEPGEFVAAGQGLLTLTGNKVEVAFGLPETLLPKVSLGQAVTLTLPLFGSRQVQGHVIELAETSTQPARLFPVVIGLNEGQDVRPGLTVSWSLQTQDKPQLTVPLQALSSPAGAKPRVYRIAGNRVEVVPVVPSEINGERVVIAGAVAAGDNVVVAGIDNLVDGYPVEVQQ